MRREAKEKWSRRACCGPTEGEGDVRSRCRNRIVLGTSGKDCAEESYQSMVPSVFVDNSTSHLRAT